MLVPQTDLWYFQQFDIEQRVPKPVLETITEEGRLERWGHHAEIYHDKGCSDLRVVLQGGVNFADESSARSVLLKRGDLFGRTLVDKPGGTNQGQPRSILRAHDETTLCIVPYDRFQELTRAHLGEVSTKIGGWVKRKTISVPVLPLLFTSPQSRLAKILIYLVESDEEYARNDKHLPVTIKLAKLVQLSGLDKSRVQHLLQYFNKEGIIQLNRRDILVASLDRLRALTIDV